MPIDQEKIKELARRVDARNLAAQERRMIESINRKDPEIRDPKTGRPVQGFRKGGKVKKTGVYKLHKGEKVVTAKAAKKAAARKSVAHRLAGRRI